VAFAQSDAQKSQSDAQKSFDQLKALSASWEGVVKTNPPTPEADGKHVQVTLRVTSMGNALLHEMKIEGRPDDPITMLYMDNDRLTLTHYCDAGIGRAWWPGRRQTEKRWTSIFSTSPVICSMDTCSMQCSP